MLALVLLLVAQGMLSGCGYVMMPTPLHYRDSGAPTFDEINPRLRGGRMSVLYVTDRKPASEETRDGGFYGSERSTSSVLGDAIVEIGQSAGTSKAPKAHGGSTPLVPARRSRIDLASVTELVRFPETPYPYRVGERGRIERDPRVVTDLRRAEGQARAEILRRLSLTRKKDVYVDVHGVGTRFDDAILDLAAFWHFLGREGVPLAYTWPAGSKGLLFYAVDRENGEFTVLHFKELLRLLASIPEIERIHISAHSRGADVVTTALRELIIELRARGLDPREQLRIENLILIAADIDLDVAMQRINGEAIGPTFGRVTLYLNTKDKALAAAKRLFRGSHRVGSIELVKLGDQHRDLVRRAGNLDVIVYQGRGGGFSRHGYYTDPAVSSDILLLLRHGLEPRRGWARLFAAPE